MPSAAWISDWSTSCVHECFEAQARQTPEAIAVTAGAENVSYQELDRRADCLARRLRRLGVGPDRLVGVYLERSAGLVATLLGVLKASGAYVGFELQAPRQHLQSIIEEARPVAIVTSHRLADRLPISDAKLLFLDDLDWQAEDRQDQTKSGLAPDPSNLAYVSFTSGSTARPRGVCIPHRGVVRLAADTRHLHVRADEVFLHLSPISFDASTFEIWACLLNGARLVIYPPGGFSPDTLGACIRDYGVTTLWLTAGLFHLMVDARVEALRPLRRLFAGGDVLSVTHVRKAFSQLPDCRIINGYGPTEDTTFTCCHQVETLPTLDRPLPIGTPLDHTEVYVLDEQLREVQPGTVGELFTGGDGLARGYLNLPDLTARKFIRHPFSSDPAARLYGTGDRVRQLSGGAIEFVGRIDGQVKIRGYRVEPETVEAALLRHPGVRDVAVVAQDRAGQKHLVAFVCPRTDPDAAREAGGDELRRFLRQALPPYMVPSDFQFLDALPLTPTGKVDRLALSSMPRDVSSQTETQEALSPSAAALAEIWRTVLGRARIASNQNLWELEPDSVQVLELLLRIERKFARTLTVEDLLAAPTLWALAAVLDAPLDPFKSKAIIPLQGEGTKPPLLCVPGEGGDLTVFAQTAPHLSPDRPVFGLVAADCAELQREHGTVTMENLAAEHVRAIKRSGIVGPVHLCGFCFGGLLAFEIARQLAADGRVVGLLAVLDFSFADAEPFKFKWGVISILSLLRNIGYWLVEFVEMRPDRRRELLATTLRTIARWTAGKIGLEGRLATIQSKQPREHSPQWAAHAQAWRQYVPGSYAGVITLFRPRRLALSHPYDATLGWGGVKSGGLDIEIVPGPGVHGAMLRMPHAIDLAQRLRQSMERAEAELAGGIRPSIRRVRDLRPRKNRRRNILL